MIHLTRLLNRVIGPREIAAPLPNTEAAGQGPLTPEGEAKHYSEATTLAEFYRLRRLAYPCATTVKGQVKLCRQPGCECAEYYRILRENKVNQHISRDERPHEVALDEETSTLDHRLYRRWAEEAWG